MALGSLVVLEVSRFGVPFVDLVWNGIEGHDPFHERSGKSGGEETDQDIVVRDAGTSGIALESRDVALERRGVLPILLCHVVGGQPGDGVLSHVLVFERRLELLKEVIPGS